MEGLRIELVRIGRRHKERAGSDRPAGDLDDDAGPRGMIERHTCCSRTSPHASGINAGTPKHTVFIAAQNEVSGAPDRHLRTKNVVPEAQGTSFGHLERPSLELGKVFSDRKMSYLAAGNIFFEPEINILCHPEPRREPESDLFRSQNTSSQATALPPEACRYDIRGPEEMRRSRLY